MQSTKRLSYWVVGVLIIGILVVEHSRQTTAMGYLQNKLLSPLPLATKVQKPEKDQKLGEFASEVGPLIEKAINFHKQGNYKEAVSLAEKALVIQEKAIKELSFRDDESQNKNRDLQLGLSRILGNLGLYYEKQKDLAAAETVNKRALQIYKSLAPTNYFIIAKLCANLASVYLEKGEHRFALTFAQQAQDNFKQAVAAQKTNNTEDLAKILEIMGVAYFNLGEYPKALAVYNQAEPSFITGYHHRKFRIGDLRQNIGAAHLSMGEYAKAEEFFKQAQELYESALSDININKADKKRAQENQANLLQKFGVLARLNGNYPEAEKFYQQAMATKKQLFGADHPEIAGILQNLGVLYKDKGDYVKAEEVLQQALAMREKAMLEKKWSNEDQAIAQLLNDLGLIYKVRRDFSTAEGYYQRALAISTKKLGKDHVEVGRVLHNLGVIYQLQNKFTQAAKLLRQAIVILENTLGDDSPIVADSLNNLAGIKYRKGQYLEAESLYQRALKIREKQFSYEHPDVAKLLQRIGLVNFVQGNKKKARYYLAQGNEIQERHRARNLAMGSEAEKLAYLSTTNTELMCAVSFQVQSASQDPESLKLAATAVLRRKGRSLDAMTDTLALVRKQATPEEKQLLAQLTAARRRLAQLWLNFPVNPEQREYYRTQLQQTKEEMEQLEKQIVTSNSAFHPIAPISLAAVQAEIPDNTVLIEMATYTALNLQTLGRGIERYVAYLIDNKKVLGYVDLGAAKRIDQAVATLRRVIASPKTDINHAVKLQARKLDQLVMAPIRPLIGNYKNLLISPDGALNLIPFEVLVDENKRYLIETYESNYLTSGRDLLRLQTKTASQTPPLVIADPDYGRGKGPLLAGKQYSELQPLPQALEEAVKIQTLFPQTQIYRGTQATKEVMLVAQSPEILHISTHGYFLTDAALEPDEVSESLLNNDLADWEPGLLENDGLRENEKRLRHSTDLDHDALRAANPLLRSWLFFAGANSNEKSEQGVLTALEVAGLNLFGTKLVVLSACDTGLGTVKNGDGVYGLRRALVLAGAETQLVSLWAVNANATRDLLNEYYQQLKNDIPRRTALRQIALKFLNNKQYAKYRHPYFWASFIQSGEWGKLNN